MQVFAWPGVDKSSRSKHSTSAARLKFVEEIIDLEDGSQFVIPARLGCLVVGQPFDRLRAGSFQASS